MNQRVHAFSYGNERLNDTSDRRYHGVAHSHANLQEVSAKDDVLDDSLFGGAYILFVLPLFEDGNKLWANQGVRTAPGGVEVLKIALIIHALRSSDKGGDKRRLGIRVQFGRRADLLDASLIRDDDFVGDFNRLFLVVRHEDARDIET